MADMVNNKPIHTMDGGLNEFNIEPIANGTHPDTPLNHQGHPVTSTDDDSHDTLQPLSHFHSLFYDLFTWKFPKATGFFFFTAISLIFAFRYVNVLRYVFKAAYMLFAGVAALEIAGKPLGARGVVSSLRPKRYYTIPRESLERLFEQLHDFANFCVLEFQRVVFVENIFTTLAAFITSFFGYFLIKYIPFWTLILLTTITAFTAPLLYLNNKEFVDEQLHNVSEIVNAQLDSGKKLTEQYAGEAAARAKATAADLSSKVQGYTGGLKSTQPTDINSVSEPSQGLATDSEFPSVPKHDFSVDKAHDAPIEPLLA
ncbi:Reticulon-domain-containing protein [Geopyxis carbonaria]|nr:Reticulon-domain-containing protein [Geopyxis carbonaria]